MPDVVYTPVLKGRQGELTALSLIQPATRQHILPLLELVPGSDDEAFGRSAVRSVIEKAAKKLRTWAGQRLLLDVGLLATEIDLRDGIGAVGFSILEALDQGVRATPTLRLDDGPQARLDAAMLHADLRCGIGIRLSNADLDEDYEDIDEALTGFLRELSLRASDVDLVLDLGSVIGDLAVRAGARLAADLLRGLAAADEWRQVIVAAGAFPSDLNEVSPWSIGELPRYDAALYDRLQERRRLPRAPIFGDYAVTHPVLVTGLPYRASPQLRYAVADKWLVLKGARNDPRANERFYDVCERIAQHPEFVGAALGNADARIANPRSNGQGPGNASTWRALGTAHHLDYVVRRITTLDEP